MQAISSVCFTIAALQVLAMPILLVIWFVRKITKKPKMKWLKWFWLSFAAFVVIGGLTNPQTWCKHDYELIESKDASCEESGYELSRCNLCGKERKSTFKKLGHDLKEIRRVNPTYEKDGEIVKKCSRCGYEEIDILKKLKSPAEPTQTENTDEGNLSEATKPEKAPSDSDIVVAGETIYGFYDVIDAVGIDRVDAKRIKKTDDWRLGPCYIFQTEGTTARVNCNMDGTINSVEVGNQIMLYQQGYEPWNIADFIVSDDVKVTITIMVEDAVKQYLNYPATAEFPILDWVYGRRFNRYSVKSHVTARNGFGVESEFPFTAQFWVEDGTASLIYLEVGGSVVKNETEKHPIPERKTVAFEVEQPTNGSIRICDGQIGEYGQKVELDSYEYYWYMVPAGKYKAVSNVKTCTVYVDKNEITRNSEGYVEMENVASYTWSYGESVIIDIGEDEHLFNVYGADYTLTPIDG